MDFTFTSQLHYLIHYVDGDYVAHCLDMDLVGTGETKDDAVCALNTAVRALVYFALKSREFEMLSTKAPERYWDLFSEASKSGTQIHTLEISPELSPVQVNQCHFTYCLAMAA